MWNNFHFKHKSKQDVTVLCIELWKKVVIDLWLYKYTLISKPKVRPRTEHFFFLKGMVFVTFEGYFIKFIYPDDDLLQYLTILKILFK